MTGVLFEVGVLAALDDLRGRPASTEFDIYVGSSAGASVDSLVSQGISAERIFRALGDGLSQRSPGSFQSFCARQANWACSWFDVPTEYGGVGLGKTTSMLLAEQFSRVGSFSVSLGAHTGIGTMPIVYFGIPSQKAACPPEALTPRVWLRLE